MLYTPGIGTALFKKPIYGLLVYTLLFYAYTPSRW